MSLDTLLEAAEFLEWRSQAETRVEELEGSDDLRHYARNLGNGSDSSLDTSLNGRSPDPEDKDRRRTGGAGTREVHNKLEKNRRAHLKECFDFLKKQIPNLEDKRTSNLSILRGSLRYIQVLKRKEKEYEIEMQLLIKEKVSLQERINSLKSELDQMNIEVDLNMWMANPEPETNSTSTATETGSFIWSDDETDQKKVSCIVVSNSSEVSGISVPASVHVKHPSAPITKTSHVGKCGSGTSSSMTQSFNPVMPALPLVAMSPVRTPVTQILHQTLTQRQALLRQQTPATQVTSVQASNIRPASHVMKSIAQVRAPFTLTSTATSAAHVAVIPKFATTGSVPIPVSTLAKGQAQPFFVTTTLTSPNTLLASPNTLAAVLQHAKTGPTSGSMPTNASNVSMKTTVAQTSAATTVSSALPGVAISSVPTVKQIPNPNAQLMAAGQLTLSPLLAQTLNQSNVSSIVDQSSNAPVTTPTTQVSQTILPLSQITPINQILSPMAVMPPGIQMTGLSQAQLNSVLAAQPIMKQFPLLQPHILQTGQMIGQPVVMTKPLVVVTTTANTAAVHVSVTKSS